MNRNPKTLALAAVLLVAFIAGMVAVTLSVSGGDTSGTSKLDGPKANSANVIKPGVRAGAYQSKFVRFPLPAGAQDVSIDASADTEDIRFAVGDIAARVNVRAAQPGYGTRELAYSYRSSSKVQRAPRIGRGSYLAQTRAGNLATITVLHFKKGLVIVAEATTDRAKQRDAAKLLITRLVKRLTVIAQD